MCSQALFWWRLPESNWGHTDFQSVALPTELKRQPFILKVTNLLIPVVQCKFIWRLNLKQAEL